MCAQQAQVHVGAHHNGEVSVEGADPSDAFRSVVIQRVAVVRGADDAGNRQKRFQTCGDANRPGSWAASAMRSGEGLVQVEVHDIYAHIAGAGNSQQRVEVGAVAVDQTAALVHDFADIGNFAFKEPQRIGIGDHDGGGLLIHGGFDRFRAQMSVLFGGKLHDLIAAQCGRCRIGAVSGVGNQHLTADVAHVFVKGADHHHAGQLAVGARGGGQRNGLEACNFTQHLCQVIHQLQRAL